MAPKQPPPPPLSSYRPASDQGPVSAQVRRGPPPPMRVGGPGPQGPRRAPSSRGGIGFFGALFYLFLLLLIVAGAGASYLLINPPTELIKARIVEQVKLRTGRDLIVAGPATLTFYPTVGVTMDQVALSAPPGMTGNLVTMQSLDVSVSALPLLQQQIEVTKLILTKPVFDLRIAKSGKRNWDFASAQEPVRLAQAAPTGATATDAPPAEATGGRRLPQRLADIKQLHLDDVRIADGTMRLTDERTGKTQEVKAVNVNVGLQSLQSPITASGHLAWMGERVDFEGKLTDAKTVLEEKPAQLAFKSSGKHFSADYNGRVFIQDGADLEGKVTARSDSARALAQWLGTALPDVDGFGPLSIGGNIKTKGNQTTFSNATFELDGANATGTLTVKTGAARPYVNANLTISELDLNKYIANTGSAPIATSAPQSAGSDGGGDAIEQLLNKPESKAPATKVYGAVQREGWSSSAINLTLLAAADADAKLQVGRLLYQDLKIGQSALTTQLRNRVLKTTFDDVRLYDGRGAGQLNIDGTGKAAAIGANFGLQSISALPFLKDAAGMEWLAGKANLALQLNANGASQLQLVETLNGKADLTFNDGAIVGFNVAGAVRGLQQGKFVGLKTSPSDKTDFSEMKATFAIANGVAQNQDLLLVSPLLRVTGSGAIQMPPRTLDYTIKPKLVASLEGQSSTQTALSGLEIPVRISGPWSKPKYEPDLKGVLDNPEKTVEAVKELGKKLKGKNANEIVDELFGKKEDGSSSGAKDLLNKFLKPQ